MGCDIHGTIEGRHAHRDWWDYVVDIGGIVGRNYDLFGNLFGVRNMAGFEPAFPDRGIPEDISWRLDRELKKWGGEEYRTEERVDFHSSSYVWLEELIALDWDEEAEQLDSRVSVLNSDKEPTGVKFALSPYAGAGGWTEIAQENEGALARGEAVPNEQGNRYIQRQRLTRRDTLSGPWEWIIFDLMPAVGRRYGYENVRLMVYFDN